MDVGTQSWAVHTDMLWSELQVPLGEFGLRAFNFQVPFFSAILFPAVDFQSEFSDLCIAPKRSVIWDIPPL